MTYIVLAYLDGHWTTVLTTTDLDHAKAFRREMKGTRSRIESFLPRVKR
jgi:hypothetical protein